MWRNRTWRRLAVRTLVLGTVVVLAPSVVPEAAVADDDLVQLDTVAPDQGFTPPTLITTRSGVTLAAWSRSGEPDRIVLKRAVGKAGSWTSPVITMGPLTTVSGVKLLDDPKAKRTFLVADGRGEDLAATLGTYVWASTNQGATWQGPTKVWDSFGSSYAALDGKGGLYLLVNQTGAQFAHVPADLTMQRFYENEWFDLGGRLGSRGYLDLASAGASSTLLLSFQSSQGPVFVHRGVTVGEAVEVRAFTKQFGPVPVAGDAKGAAVGAIRAWPGNGNRYRVYVRSINPATGSLGTIKQLSAKDEEVSTLTYQLQHLATPNAGATGRLLAVWVKDNGDLRWAKSLTTNPSGAWSTPITVKKAVHGKYSHFTSPSANQYWMVSLGYRVKGGANRPVVVATRVGVDH